MCLVIAAQGTELMCLLTDRHAGTHHLKGAGYRKFWPSQQILCQLLPNVCEIMPFPWRPAALSKGYLYKRQL